MTSGLADGASDGDLYLASEVQSNVANAREPCSQTVRLPAIGARPPDFWRLPILCYLCVCVGGSASGGFAPRLADAHCRRRPFC